MPPKSRKPRAKKAPHYKKTYKVKGQKAKKTTGLLKIQTLQPKELFISIPYNQTIYYSDMGAKENFITPLHFSVNMNNPIATSIIAQPISGDPDQSDYNPVYTVENTNVNLLSELSDYWGKHARAIVTSSSCKVQCTQELNQYKLEQWYDNLPASGQLPGENSQSQNWSTNHPQILQVYPPVLDGDVYVSQVKTTTAINTAAVPYLTATNLNDLKTKVSGLQMRNLKCRKDTSRGCLLSSSYTPQRAFDIKDLSDNLDKFSFHVEESGTNYPPGKIAYNNLGINGRVPIAFTSSVPSGKKCPTFKVQVRVMYNIKLYRRKNILGENQEIPHTHQTPRHDDFN